MTGVARVICLLGVAALFAQTVVHASDSALDGEKDNVESSIVRVYRMPGHATHAIVLIVVNNSSRFDRWLLSMGELDKGGRLAFSPIQIRWTTDDAVHADAAIIQNKRVPRNGSAKLLIASDLPAKAGRYVLHLRMRALDGAENMTVSAGFSCEREVQIFDDGRVEVVEEEETEAASPARPPQQTDRTGS